ncbi:MAG: M28 family peptidase [Acidobacteria bacterium]|nr:M28 family peptidase [Acidobacteriota bacterium]
MTLLRLALLTVLVTQATPSSSPIPAHVRTAADGIVAEQLARDLAFLASDDLQGRATPSPGFDKAAGYIVNRLKKAGVTPAGDNGTYLQTYEMHESRVDAAGAFIQIGANESRRLRPDTDFVLRSFAGEPLTGTWPVVYVGHGWVIPDKGIDPYAGVDVRGKVVLTHGPRAMPKDVTIQQFGRVTVGASNVTTEAARRGAVAVVMIPQTSAQPGWWQQLQGQNMVRRELHPWVPSAYAAAQVTSALLTRDAIDALMAGESFTAPDIVGRGDSQDYPASFALSKTITFSIPSTKQVHRPYNIVAKIEGRDPALRNEYITVMAHLDGAVGTRTVDGDNIYNSADDNATGSATMLSIVEQMMTIERPKRSMIFVWDSGEEVGLWGTRYFVANPPVPLSSVVAHFNIDMVGATRAPGTADADSPDATGPNEVFLIGPGVLSATASAFIERVNAGYLNMTLNRKDDRWDSEFFYPRTDAGPFLERGILTIGWTTGLHRRYHLPVDEAQFLDPVKMQAIGRTVFATLWMMADDPARPRIENPIPVSVPRHR